MALTARLYSRVHPMYGRVRPILPELIRFLVVGGIGTVVDLGGAALLHGKYHVEPLAAKAISTAAATVVTYLGSRFWTFKHRENQELRREAVLFIVLNLVGLLIAEVVVGFVTYVMSLHGQLEYNAASLIGTGCGTIFRYYAYKRWVFLPPGDQADAGTAAPAAQPFPDYPPWELDPSFLRPAQPVFAAPAPPAPALPAPALAAPTYPSPWGQQPSAFTPAAPPPPPPSAPAYSSPWDSPLGRQPAAWDQQPAAAVPEPHLEETSPPYAWEPTEHIAPGNDANARLASPAAPAPGQEQRRPAGRHRRH